MSDISITKFIKGYKAIALMQILVSIVFFFNPGTDLYGRLYGFVNFFGAGILFSAALLAYFSAKRWKLWLLTITMAILVVFNTVWFIIHSTFFATGFPLIAYDLLFIIANLHFLGKGLK
jgi:hypothetical protein